MNPPASAGDCNRLIDSIYGAPLGDEGRVLHATALWADPWGGLATLRIGPATPRSGRDRFVLGLTRARADAVLTTGKILREEPELRHRYLDDPVGERAFAEWRRETRGRRERPRSVVLSSGRALDFRHPIFHDGAPVTVLTTEGAARRLRRDAPPGVEVVGHPNQDARNAIAFLARGGRVVSVEAGASTTRNLYQAPIAVEELILSTFLASAIPKEVRGADFGVAALLGDAFQRIAGGEFEESSGRWRFERYRRH